MTTLERVVAAAAVVMVRSRVYNAVKRVYVKRRTEKNYVSVRYRRARLLLLLYTRDGLFRIVRAPAQCTL